MYHNIIKQLPLFPTYLLPEIFELLEANVLPLNDFYIRLDVLNLLHKYQYDLYVSYLLSNILIA